MSINYRRVSFITILAGLLALPSMGVVAAAFTAWSRSLNS